MNPGQNSIQLHILIIELLNRRKSRKNRLPRVQSRSPLTVLSSTMAPQHNPFVLSGFPDARYSLAYPLHAATVGLADTAFKQALLAPDCNALRRDGLGNTPLMLLLYRVAHQANNTLPLATVLDRMNELLKKVLAEWACSSHVHIRRH